MSGNKEAGVEPVETMASEAMLSKWVGDQLYYPRNVIAHVVRALPSPDKILSKAITELVEIHALEISGLETGFSCSVDSIVFDEIRPVFVWAEKYGKPVARALQALAEYRASVSSRESASFDVLFIEPDPLGKNVIEAWLCNNMTFDRFDGVPGLRRISGSEQDAIRYSVQFVCKPQRGPEVMKHAQEFLDSSNRKESLNAALRSRGSLLTQ